MRVVFTNHITDDTRRLLIRLVVIVAEFAHGVEDASMYGLEAISYIRQCPSHDHAHGVVEVGLLHLVFKIDVQDFFCELAHPLTSLGSVDFLGWSCVYARDFSGHYTTLSACIRAHGP